MSQEPAASFFPMPNLMVPIETSSVSSSTKRSENLGCLSKFSNNWKICKWLKADQSFFYFKHSNPLRKWAIRLVEWRWFERFCLGVIAVNCVTIAMNNPCELSSECTTIKCVIVEIIDHFVSVFFLFEMLVRMLACCAVGHRNAYLANSWNRLDFVIVLASVLEYGFASDSSSNWTLMRVIRILRPIRAVKRIPSLRLLVTLLCDTLPALSSVMALIVFIYFIFGIIGVQLWSGVLRQRCFLNDAAAMTILGGDVPNSSRSTTMLDEFSDETVSNASNRYSSLWDQSAKLAIPPFYKSLTVPDFTCGGLLQCTDIVPFELYHSMCEAISDGDSYHHDAAVSTRGKVFCKQMVENNSYNQCRASDVNPFNGGISFDNIFSAFITIFQAVSPEGWTDIMYIVQDAYSFWAWPYFVFLVAIVTFGISNLSFIIVAVQIPQTKRRLAQQMKQEDEDAKKAKISNLFSMMAGQQMVMANAVAAQKSLKDALPKSESHDHVSGSKLAINESEARSFYTLLVDLVVDFIREHLASMKKRRRQSHDDDLEKNNVISTTESESSPTGKPKLPLPLEEEEDEAPSQRCNCCQKVDKCREICQDFVSHLGTTIFIATAIMINTIMLAAEHHNQPQLLTTVAEWMNLVFSILFTIEVVFRLFAFGFIGYIRDGFNMLDLIIVVISLVDLTQSSGSRLSVLRTFRLLRIVKLLRFLPAMQQQLTALFRTLNNVAPFLVLFSLFLFIFCVLGNSLFGCKYCNDSSSNKLLSELQLANLTTNNGDLVNISNLTSLHLTKNRTCLGDNSARFGLEKHNNFESLLTSLLTVLKVLTQDDGWADVLRDTMFISSSNWPAIYFVCLVMFGNYVILSMLLAIIDVGSSPTATRIRQQEAANLRFSPSIKSLRNSAATSQSEIDAQPPFFGLPKNLPKLKRSGSSNGSLRDGHSLRSTSTYKFIKNPIAVSTTRRRRFRRRQSATRLNRKNSYIKTRDRHFQRPMKSYLGHFSQVTLPEPRDSKFISPSMLSMSSDGIRSDLIKLQTKPSEDSLMTSCATFRNPNQSADDETSSLPSMMPAVRSRGHHQYYRRRIPAKFSGESINAASDEGCESSSLNSVFESDASSTFLPPRIPRRTSNMAAKLATAKYLAFYRQQQRLPSSQPQQQRLPKIVVEEVDKFNDAMPTTSLLTTEEISHESDDRSVMAVVSYRLNKAPMSNEQPKAAMNEHSKRSDFSLFLFSPTNRLRRWLIQLINSSLYDKASLIIVAESCITVMLERPSIQSDSIERQCLNAAGYFFSGVFFLEAVMKIIAFGFVLGEGAYLKSGWNVLDFILVVLSIVDLAVEIGASHGATTSVTKAFRGLRLLRTFRPLRAINRTPALKGVTGMLGNSVKSLANVIFICSIFYFAFAVLGLQMLRGCFYRCVIGDVSSTDEGDGLRAKNQTSFEVLESSPHAALLLQLDNVRTRDDCLAVEGLEWQNPKHNFDNFLESLRALLVVATFDGWIEIAQNGVDCVGMDQQPVENYNPWRMIYFLSFLVLIGFCMVEMFVGVICTNYKHMRSQANADADADVVAAAAGKKLSDMSSRLVKRRGALPALSDDRGPVAFWLEYPKWRRQLFHLCNHFGLDAIIAVLIAANVVEMAAEHYMMPRTMQLVFKYTNYFFTAVFTLELVAKLVAFGPRRYCRDRWNQLDIAVCLLAIGGIVLEEIGTTRLVPAINPKIIRIIRVIRVVRALKLLKVARGVQQLLDVVRQVLPQVGSLSLFFLLLFFIYASLGVELLGRLECEYNRCEGLSRHANFHNFGMALLTLFRVSTGDKWDEIMQDVIMLSKNPETSCFGLDVYSETNVTSAMTTNFTAVRSESQTMDVDLKVLFNESVPMGGNLTGNDCAIVLPLSPGNADYLSSLTNDSIIAERSEAAPGNDCFLVYVLAPIYFTSFYLLTQFFLVNVIVAALMHHLEETEKQDLLSNDNSQQVTPREKNRNNNRMQTSISVDDKASRKIQSSRSNSFEKKQQSLLAHEDGIKTDEPRQHFA